MAKHKTDKNKQQKEELARIEAEKLMSAKAHEEAAATTKEEPSLQDRLKALDTYYKAEALKKKAALAAQYLSEARAAFRKAVSDTSDENVKVKFEEMQALEKLVDGASASIGDQPNLFGTGETKVKGVRGPNRDAGEVKAEAEAVLKLIKASGKDGISGGEILAKFPRFGSAKAGLLKLGYKEGVDFKTVGALRAMKYHAA